MKTIIYNNDNLKEEDINRNVRRGKVLIINSNDEILFVYSNNHYFLVGGRVEEGESFEECVVRETKEETGIDIKLENKNPIATITYMNQDYPSEGINTKTINKYYVLRCDTKPDMSKINLTDEEKSWNLELKYIHKDKALQILNESLKICEKKGTVKDTIEVVREYLKEDL